jgi:putative ABC transport system permease protein
MDILELIAEAASTLTLNKMRTGLAILGIIIGIGSVIALVSIGQATQQSVQASIQSLGSNLLTVMPGSTKSGAVMSAMGGATTLTNDDAEAIANSSQITLIKNVSPEYQSRAQLIAGANNSNTQVIGVTPVYPEVHNVAISVGSFISQFDVNSMSKVAVVGPSVVTNLFGEEAIDSEVLGKSLRIKGQTFTIVGVTQSKGGTGFQNQDDVVYVPLTTAQKQLFGASHLSSIALTATDADLMTDAQNEVGYFLLARHKIDDPTSADFSIFSQQDILSTASSVTGTFTTLLSGIAAISLVVGGIGIMNIMLVTVTERTREIGLRKALGAKKKTITAQFLIESIMLTFTGGIIGATVGIAASFAISKLTNSLFIVSFPSIGLAFVVSAVIGIIFGWYPANRAANLQPIEALRYE